MIRGAIQLAGPTVTLMGIALSIWGTFMLTQWYHPYSFWALFRSAFYVTTLFLTGRSKQAIQLIKDSTNFGRLNREQRPRSLAGLYLIFGGFVLQALGAFFWGIDMVWENLR